MSRESEQIEHGAIPDLLGWLYDQAQVKIEANRQKRRDDLKKLSSPGDVK